MTTTDTRARFVGLVDLACDSMGGRAIACEDDFFAGMENLTKDAPAIFLPDEYTDRGKWMDGWESRRKRVDGNDWCVVKLGAPGVVRGVDIDTAHFLGNHPPFASLEGSADGESWSTLIAPSPLRPGSQNLFTVLDAGVYTHVRLTLFPDGGVARLRVYGEVRADWQPNDDPDVPTKAGEVDLVAVRHGGLALACSDAFFGPMNNLIAPGRAANMGGGWETRRRLGRPYDDRPDWILLRLGKPGTLGLVEVDTNHFKGNFPDRCALDGIDAPDATIPELLASSSWQRALPEQKLRAHERHFFRDELETRGPYSHVRLWIHPDGGISRLRLFGT